MKAQKVVQHRQTFEMSLSDFPRVVQYIDSKFPSVDISHVKIYKTSHKAMKSVGFDNMGGCYIDLLRLIFVLNQESLDKKEKGKGKFNKALLTEVWSPLAMEDILVHEALHAVSSAMGRITQKYEHAEEEFVYTHCVDFYKAGGMTSEDIIHKHFLQFCLNDVLTSKQEMVNIFTKLKQAKGLRVIPWERNYDRYQYQAFLDRHAKDLVEMTVQSAKEMADTMIESYHKYGCRSATAEDVDYGISIRMQSLNFD